MRYKTIDAMRGLAAVGVLLCHLSHEFPSPLFNVLNCLGWVCVPVFFVISGFVIAASNAGQQFTPGYIGRFALRRSIRLDPTFWLMLCLVVKFYKPADPQTMLANMFYVWDLFKLHRIIGAQWSLAQEVQLYLLFILTSALCQQAAQQLFRNELRITVAFMAISGLATLAICRVFMISWFCVIHYWYYFIAGALSYWTAAGRINWKIAAAYLVVAGSMVWDRHAGWIDYETVVVISTASFLLACRGRLHELGKNSVLQYLGRISYSMYIGHMLPIYLIEPHLPAGILRGLTCIAASTAWATCLYYVIERPSVGWANRVSKVGKKADALAQPGVESAIAT